MSSTQEHQSYYKSDEGLCKFLREAESPAGEYTSLEAREYFHQKSLIFTPGPNGVPHTILNSGVYQTMVALSSVKVLQDQLNPDDRKKLLPWDLAATMYENLAMMHAREVVSGVDPMREDKKANFVQILAESVLVAMPDIPQSMVFVEAQDMYIHGKAVVSTFCREHPGKEKYASWSHWLEKTGQVWELIHEGKDLPSDLQPYTLREKRSMTVVPVLKDPTLKIASMFETRKSVEPAIDADYEKDTRIKKYLEYLESTLTSLVRLQYTYQQLAEKKVEIWELMNAVTTIHLGAFLKREGKFTEADAAEEQEAVKVIKTCFTSEDKLFTRDTDKERETVYERFLKPVIAEEGWSYNFQEYTQVMYVATLPYKFDEWEHAFKEVLAHTGLPFYKCHNNTTICLFADLALGVLKAVGLGKRMRINFFRKMQEQLEKEKSKVSESATSATTAKSVQTANV